MSASFSAPRAGRRPHFLAPMLESSQPHGVWIERLGTWLVRRLDTAFDSDSRRRGLLGRDGLAEETGLVIAPTQGVHTFGMRFPLDIVGVGRDGRVVRCRAGVPPRRITLALRAFAMLEVPAGTIERTGVGVGDHLSLRPSHELEADEVGTSSRESLELA